MKKYSIISMYSSYDYHNNYFRNTLKDICIYKEDKNDEIDFLICGPFINQNDYNFIENKKCIKILYITEPIEINKPYNLCYTLYKKKRLII